MQKIIRVYRIQNADGHGPWHSQFNAFHAIWSAIYDANTIGYQGPAKDKLYKYIAHSDNYYFCCTSKRMLRFWFGHPEIIAFLHDNGYQIVEYDAPSEHVHMGKAGTQAVFLRKKSTRIKTSPISKLRSKQKG